MGKDIYSNIFRALSTAIPLHSEESELKESITMSEIAELLVTESISPSEAQTTVGIVTGIFKSLGLLDQRKHDLGEWAFVSFSASLLARSVLETISSDNQEFFPRGYWSTGGHKPESIVEEQRQLLSKLERRRVDSHPTHSPAPIRTVHVAWGIIKLGNTFLMHAREDKKRPGSKNYVFPGGRLDISDTGPDSCRMDLLKNLFRIPSSIANQSIINTLKREIHEELGLIASEYEYDHLLTLSPYLALEGPKNHHAWTQYSIHIFGLSLSPLTEVSVILSASRDRGNWTWFTAKELVEGRNSEGDSVFVDALSQHFENKMSTQSFLESQVAESSQLTSSDNAKANLIEFPAQPDSHFMIGMTGREKPLGITATLQEWEALIILAWHTKGLDLSVRENAFTVLGGSWVEMHDPMLVSAVCSISEKMSSIGLPIIEVVDDSVSRLKLVPRSVFFSPECYSYSWVYHETVKTSIRLNIDGLSTRWAKLEGNTILIPLSPNFSENIALIERNAGDETSGDVEREHRDHFKIAQELGLRKFITSSKGIYEILVSIEE